MKMKKKTVMLISFCLGFLLLATTALADSVSKSGYDQLKDGLKTTVQKLSEGEKIDSFTVDFSIVMKNNGEVLMSGNEVIKVDRINGARESFSTQENVISSGNHSFYIYTDNKVEIRRSGNQDIYYVTEFVGERTQNFFANPFKEQGAEDIERILDAVVGNLKDHVMVNDNPDGSKELSGSLSKMQIPALINAIASFQLKQQSFSGGQAKIPHLTQDIFVKEISGKAVINADGIMESILGTVLLSGKDEQGQTHEISVEGLWKISDINDTKVTPPDLTGKKIEKSVTGTERDYTLEISNPQKFVGLYKNDIVLEKDGEFLKIGERFVRITHLDGDTVTGRYYEVYKEGFESHFEDFQFDATFEKDPRHVGFRGSGESAGISGSISFDESFGRVHFFINQYDRGRMFDSAFSRVFDQ